MNQEISPAYVSFEQAKWLKEKGFNQRTKMVWLYSLGKQHLREVHLSLELNDAEYNAPEQWQVVEWLRVNHGIWILVLPQDRSGINFRIDMSEYPSHALFFTIIKYEKDMSCKELINTSDDKGELFLHFDIPQEAYSAAFDYIKDNNLI